MEIAQGPAGEHQAEDPADVQHQVGEQDEDGHQRIGAEIDQGQLAAAQAVGLDRPAMISATPGAAAANGRA